jgi:hypothetical protein
MFGQHDSSGRRATVNYWSAYSVDHAIVQAEWHAPTLTDWSGTAALNDTPGSLALPKLCKLEN